MISRSTQHKQLFKPHDLLSLAMALTVLSLVVSWAVELLANVLFSVG